MNTDRAQRIKYGKLGEDVVAKYIKARLTKGKLIQHDELNTWTPHRDLLFGDIFIGNTRIDVKRTNFISKKSATSFLGDYFVFISNLDVENAWVLKARTVKSYMATIAEEKLEVGPSGDKGYRFTKENMYTAFSIQDLIELLNK